MTPNDHRKQLQAQKWLQENTHPGKIAAPEPIESLDELLEPYVNILKVAAKNSVAKDFRFVPLTNGINLKQALTAYITEREREARMEEQKYIKRRFNGTDYIQLRKAIDYRLTELNKDRSK